MEEALLNVLNIMYIMIYLEWLDKFHQYRK